MKNVRVMKMCKNKSVKLVETQSPIKSENTMAVNGKDERYTLEETRVDLGIQLSDDLKWHIQVLAAANKGIHTGKKTSRYLKTKLASSLKHLAYKKRLEIMGLTSLYER